MLTLVDGVPFSFSPSPTDPIDVAESKLAASLRELDRLPIQTTWNNGRPCSTIADVILCEVNTAGIVETTAYILDGLRVMAQSLPVELQQSADSIRQRSDLEPVLEAVESLDRFLESIATLIELTEDSFGLSSRLESTIEQVGHLAARLNDNDGLGAADAFERVAGAASAWGEVLADIFRDVDERGNDGARGTNGVGSLSVESSSGVLPRGSGS